MPFNKETNQPTIMVDSGVAFDLYSGESFDKFVVLFNSRICIWEFSSCINCPRQIFVSADIVSFLSLLLSSFSFYKSVFCVST